MRLRRGVLAGLGLAGAVAAVWEARATRDRVRSLDRKLGDMVRANALGRVPDEERKPYEVPTVAIVIAALDEAEAIGAVLAELPTELCGLQVAPIVVVDGGSDDTAGVVRRAGRLALRNDVTRGQGDALATGFRLALERGAAVVVTMDADGQHRPDELSRLVEPVLTGDADYVQGSRYLGAYDDAGGVRDVGVRLFTTIVNRLTGAGITDCASGVRAIRTEQLARLRLEEPQFSAAEILVESAARDLQIREVPVHVQRRSHGASKKPPGLRYPVGYLSTVVRTWLR